VAASVAINGVCEPRFEPLLDAFRANFDQGLELGASFAVTHRGRSVVDLWAGRMYSQGKRVWQRDTISHLSSTTKIALVTSFLMLVDRGLVELDAPVARYWPEFAAGGKERVTVREAMTHRGGVPGFEPAVDVTALLDWDSIAAHIAAQPHWFGGRTVLCYHPVTYGFLLGELMRRVDGRRPAQFFREELADPAGIDFEIGQRSQAGLPRISPPVWSTPPAERQAIAEPLAQRAYDTGLPAGDWTAWECFSADIPAVNGFGNARSIARLASIIAQNGLLEGRRYLSEAIIAEALSMQVDAIEPFFGRMRWGLGFTLDQADFHLPSPTSAYWGGRGGSFALMDPATGISVGYAMNNHIDGLVDPRQDRFWPVLRELTEPL
jgi:CubicO group peptidase (beta-lactamase class C family)